LITNVYRLGSEYEIGIREELERGKFEGLA